jgi:hypothetical protein
MPLKASVRHRIVFDFMFAWLCFCGDKRTIIVKFPQNERELEDWDVSRVTFGEYQLLSDERKAQRVAKLWSQSA